MKEPPKPIVVATPQEGVVSMITFHSGTEEERKNASTSLLTTFDFNESGELKRTDISYTEMPLKELPESLQDIVKADFANAAITDESIVIMRFFRNKENGNWEPIFLHDEKEMENANS